MTEVIQWCNQNNGFLTGGLSFLTLLVSVIAIIVSIKTARLPYIKKIKLSSSVNFLFSMNQLTGDTKSEFSGISINAVNVGNRNANIRFGGLLKEEMARFKNFNAVIVF